MSSLEDSVKMIDDLVTKEVEWADEATDDIQDAWLNIKNNLKQKKGE